LDSFSNVVLHSVLLPISNPMNPAPPNSEFSTGDPQSLTAFLGTAIREAPAKHYALLTNGHSGSWSGINEDHSGTFDVLSLQDLHDAIAGVSPPPPPGNLNPVILGTCNMANIETAYELAGVADYFVSTQDAQQDVPCQFLSSLAANPSMAPPAFAS